MRNFKTIKRYKPIYDNKLVSMVIIVCWLAYFSTYIGRLNYSAAMTQMIGDNFLSKSQGGLIGTCFFACYGIGQLINGFVGDKISPFKMIFAGVFLSAVANLVMSLLNSTIPMYVVWGINGVVQSMIWSPIMRIFSQVIPPERRFKACLNINTTVAAGSLSAYLLSTLLMSISGWRSVFWVAFIFLFCISIIWLVFFSSKQKSFEIEEITVVHDPKAKTKVGLVPILFVSGVFFLLFPTAIHGMLKDGITIWFPTYLVENHNIAPNFSVLLTTILPLINLSGAYIAHWVNEKVGRDDLKAVGLMFGLSAISLVLLCMLGRYNMYLAIFFAAIATSSMFGINTIIISIMPMYFGKIGAASTITGILNSATYLGCAISMGLFGSMIEYYSWFFTIFVWSGLAIVGGIFCFLISKRWREYKEKLTE